MQESENVIVCKRVKFYSTFDEDAFFEWIQKIKSIVSCIGVRDTIELTIANEKLNEDEVYELFSLFRRYKIRTKQLEMFLDFENKEALSWHKSGSHINMYPAKPSK